MGSRSLPVKKRRLIERQFRRNAGFHFFGFTRCLTQRVVHPIYELLRGRCPVFDINEKMIRDATTVYEEDAWDFIESVGQCLSLGGASLSCKEDRNAGGDRLHRFKV